MIRSFSRPSTNIWPLESMRQRSPVRRKVFPDLARPLEARRRSRKKHTFNRENTRRGGSVVSRNYPHSLPQMTKQNNVHLKDSGASAKKRKLPLHYPGVFAWQNGSDACFACQPSSTGKAFMMASPSHHYWVLTRSRRGSALALRRKFHATAEVAPNTRLPRTETSTTVHQLPRSAAPAESRDQQSLPMKGPVHA